MNNMMITPELVRSRIEQMRADSPWMEEYEIEAIICTELGIDPSTTPDLYMVMEAALRGSRAGGNPANTTTVAGHQYSTISTDVTGKFGAYEAVNRGAAQRRDMATRALYTLTENAARDERSSAVLEKARISISRNIKQEVSIVGFTLLMFTALSVAISFAMVLFYTIFNYSSSGMNSQFRLSDIDAFVTEPRSMAILHAAMLLVCLAVPFVIYVYAHKLPVHEMTPLRKVRKGEFMPMFLMGLGALTLDGCLVNYLHGVIEMNDAAVGGLTTVRGGFYSFDAISFGSSALDVFLTIVCLGIIPALIETFVFSGVILQVLRRRGGDSYALFMSSLLYALTTGDFVEMIGSFVSCMLLGYMVIYSGSLIPAAAARLAERLLFVGITQIGFSIDSDINAVHYIDCLVTIIILIAAVFAARTMFKRFPEMFVLKKSDPCLTNKEKVVMSLTRPAVILLIVVSLLISVMQVIPINDLTTYADNMIHG